MSIEDRVSLLEQKVTQILEKMESRPQKPGWITKITGSFADCPEFDEVVRLGREYRQEMNVAEDQE
jgi:hypothetical protein